MACIDWIAPLVENERGSRVDACSQFLVEHIETAGIASKEFPFFNEIIGIHLFFALFFDEPVEELHGSIIFDAVGGVIDRVDERCDIFFVFEARFENVKM